MMLCSSLFLSSLAIHTAHGALVLPLAASQREPLAKRALDGEITLVESVPLANLTFGTPPQTITVAIDSGSSLLWVPSEGTQLCFHPLSKCQKWGSYDQEISTTSVSKFGDGSFTEQYADGVEVTGFYVEDVVGFQNVTLNNFVFGIAEVATHDSDAILGLGFDGSEPGLENYKEQLESFRPTLLSELYQRGLISSRLYSVWIESGDPSVIPDHTKGNIVFGGIDTEKYIPPLVSIPMWQDLSQPELAIPLTKVSFSTGEQSFVFTSPKFVDRALVDTGSSVIMLPTIIVQSVYKSLGVQNSSDGRLIACKYANSKTSFNFTLNGDDGVEISIPLSYIMEPTNAGFANTGDGVCFFALKGGAEHHGFSVLGIPFLKAVYTVFDLENKVISVARSNTGVQRSNIVNVAGGVNADMIAQAMAPSKRNIDVAEGSPTAFFGKSAASTVILQLWIAAACVHVLL